MHLVSGIVVLIFRAYLLRPALFLVINNPASE
jgi:hypothetical protein